MMSSPGVGTHPDLPDTLIHFTGRPRDPKDQPPPHAMGTPEDRLVGILREGKVRGNTPYRGRHEVICLGEPSEAARRFLFREGIKPRGPYAPWAILLNREALIAAGARPVLYLSGEEMDATNDMPASFRARRVRYEPGRADWLHEREWRLCFQEGQTPDFQLTADVVAGVIVGEQGWLPPSNFNEQPIPDDLFNYPKALDRKPRWWWNGQDLVEDGTFELRRRYEFEKWFLIDFMMG
ncbi:hypothetical protein PUR49_06530 [Streptomyces sp. BE147]|uniref:hypothetical protein n=1 Tax=Streptomyces sp. BE147 TaxID=3002524 RepID=UPI002E770E59|nr:hypothetical protein [Streptomyces sp. BE147]MEE1736166.1 hypothetical protein [Streptomyces sp. BE147]